MYALAAGMCAGLGLGENSLAGLTTRSLREMTRVAVHFGAQEETVQGLSGVGDLILTSYSRSSRNRCVGERLGLGDTVAQALASVDGVCEGYPPRRLCIKFLKLKRSKPRLLGNYLRFCRERSPPKRGYWLFWIEGQNQRQNKERLLFDGRGQGGNDGRI